MQYIVSWSDGEPNLHLSIYPDTIGEEQFLAEQIEQNRLGSCRLTVKGKSYDFNRKAEVTQQCV